MSHQSKYGFKSLEEADLAYSALVSELEQIKRYWMMIRLGWGVVENGTQHERMQAIDYESSLMQEFLEKK